MKKRTYGTGTLRLLPSGKWLFEYKPKWARKRLSKTVEAANQKAAQKLLSDWVTELDKRNSPSAEVPCSELFELKLADMRRMQRDAQNILDTEKKIAKHLVVPFFGRREAASITREDINEYVDQRLKRGAKPATINRELSNLRRAFECGFEQNKILAPLPKYKKLPEDNVRQGFVEQDIYRRLLQHLAAHLQMLWCFAYYLGIRKGELLKFRWDWLLPYWKQKMPIVKIPGKYCKNKKPHTIPIYHPEMCAMVEPAMAHRNPECPYLFQYRGRQLKNFRTGFENAREAAGIPAVIFHDTRRTAVRNMILAGIPEKRAMQISGHRTRSVFDRYDITTEKDAMETGKRLQQHWREIAEQEAQEAAEQTNLASTPEKFANEGDEADWGSTKPVPAKRLN
jgi:integrase